MRKMVAIRLMLPMLLLLAGCRITDHSERDADDVDPSVINIQGSGYEETDPASMPKFDFESTSLNFGRITQGTQVERTYRFTNAGGSDLIITDVRASCGCTVSKNWPRKPLRPGESGSIDVVFDSEGREGRQEKMVTVVANTSPTTTPLFLHGDVVAPTSGTTE